MRDAKITDTSHFITSWSLVNPLDTSINSVPPGQPWESAAGVRDCLCLSPGLVWTRGAVSGARGGHFYGSLGG